MTIHGLADAHSHATLALPLPDRRHRSRLSGAFQVVSHSDGRPLSDGVSVCQAKCVAGQPLHARRRVAMVQPLPSAAKGRIRDAGPK